MSRVPYVLMEWIGRLPLPWVRALGWLLGRLLYALVGSRRKVVQINLRLCFPQWPEDKVRAVARENFVYFAQSWLDRGWLWHASADTLRKRLKLTGAVQELEGDAPTVLFGPHFVGMDACWTALTLLLPRRCSGIYQAQANPVADAWIEAGRRRFGNPEIVARLAGVKPMVNAIKRGEPMYLLPDMNFDPKESLWVPFYGVIAATVPSLPRFSRLGRAKVVPVITRMTSEGYEVDVKPAWADYPSDNVEADTALMNIRLQGYIDAMVSQYYWVHKRFKDRPNGGAPPY